MISAIWHGHSEIDDENRDHHQERSASETGGQSLHVHAEVKGIVENRLLPHDDHGTTGSQKGSAE